ncbi:hypothetical protein IAU60_000272 [Kwoniella sp. DSM 27419]
MSRPALGTKRRSSSSSLAGRQPNGGPAAKRHRPSPSRPGYTQGPPIVNAKASRGLFGTVSDLIALAFSSPSSAMPSLDAAASSSSSSSSPSRQLFESHPGGSLAMLQDADNANRSPSPDMPDDGQGTATTPIELNDDSDEEDEDDNSIDTSRPTPSPIAGPSRRPIQMHDGPLLFSEGFSQPSLRGATGSPKHADDEDAYGSPRTRSPAPISAGLSRQPSRPNVRVTTPPRRKLGWEGRPASPSSSASSRASGQRSGSKSRNRKRSSNMRSKKELDGRYISGVLSRVSREGDLKESKSAARVMKLFKGTLGTQSAGRRLEHAFRHLARDGSSKDKERYLAMLEGPKVITLEERTAPKKPSLFQVAQKQKIGTKAKQDASRPSAYDLSDVLKSIVESDRQAEAEIAKRLKPQVPAKLAADKEAAVERHFANPSFDVRLSAAQVNAGSLRRLKPNVWLDDEVMNGYCSMMMDRAKAGSTRKVHCMTSFFFNRLSDNGYQAVRRWTKKVDIFAQDVVAFPVNIGNMHWTAAAINIEKKRLEYYDSMGDHGGRRSEIFQALRDYLKAEHQDKKGSKIDLTGWTDEFNDNTPQQDNGSDCGVFSCQTLEMITRGRDLVADGFEFSAGSMRFFRRLMVYEIGQAKLEPRAWGRPAV